MFYLDLKAHITITAESQDNVVQLNKDVSLKCHANITEAGEAILSPVTFKWFRTWNNGTVSYINKTLYTNLKPNGSLLLSNLQLAVTVPEKQNITCRVHLRGYPTMFDSQPYSLQLGEFMKHRGRVHRQNFTWGRFRPLTSL